MHEPIATTLLLLAICGVSLWAWENPSVESRLIFRPACILADKEYYRLVTSSFLHAGIWHLMANVYALYGSGGALEREFGPGRMLLVYFGGVIGGDLLSVYLHRFHDMAAYGASGGVCGLIFSYILAHPHSWMTIFPFPYPIPGWVWAIAFLIASFYALKAGRDNIGHDAHIGGAVIGLFVMALLNP